MLGVSTSGNYAWRRWKHSARAQEDAELRRLIIQIYQESHGIYGAPHIQAERTLQSGIGCSRKRVVRLMREASIDGIHCWRLYGCTIEPVVEAVKVGCVAASRKGQRFTTPILLRYGLCPPALGSRVWSWMSSMGDALDNAVAVRDLAQSCSTRRASRRVQRADGDLRVHQSFLQPAQTALSAWPPVTEVFEAQARESAKGTETV